MKLLCQAIKMRRKFPYICTSPMLCEIFSDDIFWNGLVGVDEDVPELEGEIGATMNDYIPYEGPLRDKRSKPI